MGQPSAEVAAVLDELWGGPLHRFADWHRDVLPRATAGVYTIWDVASGDLVYVGMAGTGVQRPEAEYGLVKRLRRHASGARSGDRFCIYVQDHFILPDLSRSDIEAIAARRIRLDDRVRDYIRQHLGFRFAATATARLARAIEDRIKAGQWPPGPPLLNPAGMPD